jgi:hypothetical protein
MLRVYLGLLLAFSVLGTATMPSLEVGSASGLAPHTHKVYRKKGSIVPSWPHISVPMYHVA